VVEKLKVANSVAPPMPSSAFAGTDPLYMRNTPLLHRAVTASAARDAFALVSFAIRATPS
jgi:hypothetical protein